MKKLILSSTMILSMAISVTSCKDNKSQEEAEITDSDNQSAMESETNSMFSQYDEDGNGELSEMEFSNYFNKDISNWDNDGDGFLGEEEFFGGIFSSADLDNNDSIDENEWGEGYDNFYNSYANEDDFGTFDANDDGFLDNNEWNDGFADSSWFDDYDQDGDNLLADSEWNNGLYTEWDTNGDGFINENEFVSYNGYYDRW